MKESRILLLFVVLALGLYSCGSKKELPSYDLDFTLQGEVENLILSANSSNPYDQLKLKDGTVLSYHYSKSADRGPSLLEEIARSKFNFVEHRPFFENGLIDPKVYKIFLDSVEIIDVLPISKSDTLLYECEACPSILKVKFFGEDYTIPSSVSKKVLEADYSSIEKVTDEEYYYKYYYEDGIFNLSAIPVKNNFNSRKILHVKCEEGPTCSSTLKSLRMKQ